VISTALKAGHAEPAWHEAATKSMTTLNKLAAEVATEFDAEVHGGTDVTGFGLIGHVREMVLAGKVSVRIDAAKVPVLPGALECVRAGYIPGGLNTNRDFAECLVEYGPGVDDATKALLFDPQTAGGLLLAVTPEAANRYIDKLKRAGGAATVVGEILPHQKPLIRVV
jgi:selenide, water dikinase